MCGSPTSIPSIHPYPPPIATFWTFTYCCDVLDSGSDPAAGKPRWAARFDCARERGGSGGEGAPVALGLWRQHGSVSFKYGV